MHSILNNISKKKLIFILLSCIYFINGIIIINKNSITIDEGDHHSYAVRIVKGHPEKVKPYDDASAMPITVLNTVPRVIQQLGDYDLKRTDWGLKDIKDGRYISLILFYFTGIFILIWSNSLFGINAALYSFFLFTFCPNLLAHGVLLATDGYSALLTVSTAFFFWKYIQKQTILNLIYFSISLGIAQICKQSLTHLFIIFFLLSLYFFLIKDGFLLKKNLLIHLSFSLLIVLIIINTGFLFYKTGQSLHEYDFKSSFFINFRTLFSVIENFPLPIPEPYLFGMDRTKHMDEIGGGNALSSGSIYLLGNKLVGKGFWYYYFVLFFFKTPISLIFIFFMLLITLVKEKGRRIDDFNIVIWFIIIYLLIYFNFFYKSQVGIRHIIMIYPLLLAGAGCVYKQLFANYKFILIPFIIYSIITFYSFFPNVISYTNEFVLPKYKAYKIMADSNLDYGQGKYELKKYLTANKDVQIAKTVKQTGKIIIGVNSYLDLYNTGEYAWLKMYEPIDHLNHCYLIFYIPQ